MVYVKTGLKYLLYFFSYDRLKVKKRPKYGKKICNWQIYEKILTTWFLIKTIYINNLILIFFALLNEIILKSVPKTVFELQAKTS